MITTAKLISVVLKPIKSFVLYPVYKPKIFGVQHKCQAQNWARKKYMPKKGFGSKNIFSGPKYFWIQVFSGLNIYFFQVQNPFRDKKN